MKKIFALALATLMVMGLFAGCADSQTSSGLLNEGKLVVSISPDFAPMEFVDPTKEGQDQFVGFDVSLAKYIAQELGVELEIMPMDFDACQLAVGSGTVDMSISGYSWTEKREKNYNMSDYYYAGDNETEQVLIVLKENEGKYTTAESLKGLKIGAQGASLQEELVKNQLPDCTLVSYTDINTGLQQLKKGDFDAMAVAIGNANALINNNPDIAMSGFQFVVDEKETNNLILLKKGNDVLTEKVNQILAKAEAAGLYKVWYEEALETAGVNVSYDVNGNPIVPDETDPTGSEPAGSEPAGSEPAGTEGSDSGEGETTPATTAPAASEPAATEGTDSAGDEDSSGGAETNPTA